DAGARREHLHPPVVRRRGAEPVDGRGARRLRLHRGAADLPRHLRPTGSGGRLPVVEIRMNKGRLEAFSDGVIAVIITIMVLEMKVPHGDRWQELVPLAPTFFSYILSFVYVGIYWNNHHHMLHACTVATGAMLW